jgi:CO/xanthine dehydrogenase Mo-binding subunit
MQRSIFDTIHDAKFIASEAQVEALATVVANGTYANGTYLKVLIAHAQHDINGTRKLTKEAALAVVDGIHQKFYAAVLKGVGDDTVAMTERQRRATFARTSVSDLRGYIAQGGDVRKIDVETVTKAKLRNYGRKVPTGTRAQRSLARAGDAVIRAAVHLAKKNPTEARKRLEAVRKEIDAALAKIGTAKAPRAKRGAKRAALSVRTNGRIPVVAPGLH